MDILKSLTGSPLSTWNIGQKHSTSLLVLNHFGNWFFLWVIQLQNSRNTHDSWRSTDWNITLWFYFTIFPLKTQCLIGNTGLRNPQLMSNWKHLLQDCKEVIKLFDDLMEDLEEISASVDKRNEERPHKSQVFNPKFLETSVSI